MGFGLFRTRMLTAGILFSAFLALPLLNWSQAFGALGLPKLELSQAVEAAVSHLRAKWFYSAVFNLFGFCVSAWGLAFFLCLFVFHCELGGRFTAVVFLVLALAASVLVAFNFQFRKRPRIGIGVCLIIIAAATVSVLISQRAAIRFSSRLVSPIRSLRRALHQQRFSRSNSPTPYELALGPGQYIGIVRILQHIAIP